MEFKIKELNNVVSICSLYFYDDHYDKRAFHGGYNASTWFKDYSFVAYYDIWCNYYKNHYKIDGNYNIYIAINTNILKNQFTIINSVFVTKKDLSNLIQCKDNNMVYNTECYLSTSPHDKIPLILHFIRNDKLSIVLSKIEINITTTQHNDIFKYLIVRQEQSRNGLYL